MAGVGKTPITPQEILEGELYGVLTKAAGEAQPLSVTTIERKIRAAEDRFEKELQLFFGHRRVVSNPQGRGIPATDYDVAIPALDYDRDWWTDERWGFFAFPYRPVVSVQGAFFAYPGTNFVAAFQLPEPWLQIDYKFGDARIVPATGQAITAVFNGYILSILSGGRGLPRSFFLDFTAGLSHDELLTDHADLLEALRIEVVLSLFGILTNVRTGGLASQSLSLDGLSRSQAFGGGKYGPYSGAIELWLQQQKAILESWRRAERGPVLMVM
jgi:hypothetical protein